MIWFGGRSFGQDDLSGPVVQLPVYFDVSPPLREMVRNKPGKAETSWKDGIIRNQLHVRPRPESDAPGGLSDPNLQTQNGPLLSDTTIANFEGNYNSEGYYPPDTHGDVGPNHYFQVVNCHFSIYSKTGTLLFGPMVNSFLFNGLPNNSNDGDAIVLYDEQADRWLFSQFSLPNYPNGPFYQMIAVSQTADPTGSWYRYQYSFTNMPDYPKFGVWPDAYYMSIHMFTASSFNYAGCGAVAFNRSLMLAGSPAATMVMFTKPSTDEAFGWLPSDCDGPFPTGNPPNYFLYNYDGTSNDHLGIYEFHVDWVTTGNSTFANFLSLPANAFTANIAGIDQPATTINLDPLNDRMMYRLQYRKFSSYATLVCNHTVDVSSSVAGIRWYELRKTTGAWSIYQQATWSLADNNSRWMGSIAMDSSGNIALGYSVSGSALYPSIRYTGRKKNDPLNQMTFAERGIFIGTGSQTGSAQRWGDYSAMSCDPSAAATFWYTTEYLATTSTNSWRTRIASFKLASTPTIATLDATSVTGTTATLNGTINPNGLSTDYHFEYGATTAYGSVTSTASAGSGTSVVAVNAPVSGLVTGAAYHFRLVATNSEGTVNGTDKVVIPGGAVVTTTVPANITTTSATGGGSVSIDGGSSVTARGVCWAATVNPTISGSHTTNGSGTGTFTSSITPLTTGTAYHVRAYATNANGTWYGNDIAFTTAACGYDPLPLSENFETTALPTCWTQVDHQGNGQVWQFGTITRFNPDPNLSGNYAYLDSDAYGISSSQNADLVTPGFDLSPYSSVTLAFSHYYRHYTGSLATLSYSTDGGSNWTQIQQWNATTSNPASFSQSLPAVAGQANVKFKWNYVGTYDWYWCVDDVQVTGMCSLTAAFQAGNLAPATNQAVAFTDLSTGSPVTWNWSFDRPSDVEFVSPTTAASQNPQVKFTAGGLFAVTLSAANAGCTDAEIKTDYIRAGTPGLWTGKLSSDWTNPQNWDNWLLPDATTDVVIPSSAANWPVYTGNLTVGTHCRNLTLSGPTSRITVTGILTLP